MGERNFHNRRSIRLKGYDYAKSGAYFVTICCKDQQCFLGRIENQEIKFTTIGKIVKMNWENIPCYFKNVTLDEYVIMPNHLHGVIVINDDDCGGIGRGEVTSPLPSPKSPQRIQKPTLGQIIAYFKYQSTKYVNQLRKTPGIKLWQRNYYEHIIHSKNDINRIRKYIIENPLKWRVDKFKILV